MRQSQSNRFPSGRLECAAALLFLALPLGAQTGAPAAAGTGVTIKTETRLVLVDAVVTARKDEPVANLTVKDFHIFEDGKEQPITAFQMHTGTAIGGIGQIQHLVLLFDSRSSDDPRAVAEAAAKFAADNAGPNRLMAVAYYSGGYMTAATQFTTDVGELQKAARDWPNVRRPSGPDPQGLVLSKAYTKLARDLAKVPGHKVVVLFYAHTMREASAGDNGGSPYKAGAPPGLGSGGGMAGPSGLGGVAGIGAGQRPDVPSASPGAPIEVSPAALTDPEGMQLEFRKADASVYVVEGQSGARAPGWVLALAEKTGGRELSRGNDVGGVLALLSREQDQSYTLAYVPADSPEGSCHTLKVTVSQPKVKVRGRDLYCNVPEAALAAAKPAEVALETLAAAAPAGNTTASVALPFFYEGRAARVNLVLEIPAPVLEPTETFGKLEASMDVLGLAYNADGEVVARFTDAARYPFDDRPQFDAFVRQPLHYEHQFKVAPGNYKFKLIFRTAKDHVGVVETPLAVDPLDAGKLGMSPIALSHDVQPISPEALRAEAGAGKKPLVFHGNRITPTASGVLLKEGISEAYFEVYQPPAQGADPVKLSMRLRLFDAPTDEQKGDSGDVDLSGLPKSADRVVSVALRLPIAMLAVGSYRAEITVKDSAGGETLRNVRFRVENRALRKTSE
jgi:hypothetical protein